MSNACSQALIGKRLQKECNHHEGSVSVAMSAKTGMCEMTELELPTRHYHVKKKSCTVDRPNTKTGAAIFAFFFPFFFCVKKRFHETRTYGD